MPRFSVVIPVFNNARYLPGCLESLACQTMEDWEAIVVVDGSPDNSAEIAHGYADQDKRIRVVEKQVNEGAHLARMTGVEMSSGDFIYLLDADDEVPFDAFEKLSLALQNRPTDMLHFGINVIDAGVNDDERLSFESYINHDIDDLRYSAICAAAFDMREGYAQDWRITQRVYRASLLKSAYKTMTKEPLGRAQDAYEYFVVSILASEQLTRNDIIALDYYYGRGVGGSSDLAPSSFLQSARDFQAVIDAIESYANVSSRNVCTEADGGAKKLIELLMNDWYTRLSNDEKLLVLDDLAEIIGPNRVATELMRFVRDDVYAIWVSGGSIEDSAPQRSWFSEATRLSESSAADARFENMRAEALRHIEDVNLRTKKFNYYNQQDIRIFVSTHKDIDLFDSMILQPVQVGASQASISLPYALKDNAGENISGLNSQYCELTTQYWAWKNVSAEYYGFCHYRRYFDFNSKQHDENAFGEIMYGYINEVAQNEFCLNDDDIREVVAGYDVVTTEFKDLRAFPGELDTPQEQYAAAPYLHVADLERVTRILKELHPDYAQDADEFLEGNYSCFCNMFIMRRDIFFDYCTWLFSILDRFMRETDTSTFSKEALRTPGHLSERLFNIYYRHHMRVGEGWKTKQLQCVHFEHPEYVPDLQPAFSKNPDSVIPIVFAADNNYVPMLTTTICSVVENASSEYQYDIVVLEKSISSERRALMREFISHFRHVSLRFVDVSRVIDSYHLVTNNEHISTETYYRFLIQELLPFYDKVIYLDSDLIVEEDISILYAMDMGNQLVAAVRDIDYLGNLNVNDGKRMQYSIETLHLNDPYAYFQAGVMILNTEELRKFRSVPEWLEVASESEFLYDDQDILNTFCQGRVEYLDYAWNVMNDCGDRISKVFSFAPAPVFDAYQKSRERPKIVHYAGYEKPWKTPHCDEAERYWAYARKTPFYEELIGLLARSMAPTNVLPARAVSEKSPLRKMLDPILPEGSRRRELAKSLGRAMRGR